MTTTRSARRWLGAGYLLLALGAPALAVDPEASPSPAKHELSWLLVRLAAPLTGRKEDGSYPVRAGDPMVDAWIRDAGIQRIENALPVSTRSPLDPVALMRHGLDRVYKFFVPRGTDVLDLVEKLSALAGVELAEPDYVQQIDEVQPDDTRFSEQWSLEQASDADVDAPEGWGISVGGGVVIGMNDSGVDSDHEDLSGKILPGFDFVNNDLDPEDDHGHGTRTASVASAVTNNSRGIAGVCWNCRLLPAKVFDASGQGNSSRSADGYVWLADHGARVINQSGGSSTASQILHDAVIYAYEAGVVLTSGTGNDNSVVINYPAAFPEVVAAGGTDRQDARVAPFSCSGSGGSNHGPEIDVVAPADLILTARMGGGYGTACGNSFAGPHVAGLSGLIETIDPSVGRDEAGHLIRSGAEDGVGRSGEDTPGWDRYHGWGRINVARTLAAIRSSITLRLQGTEATRVLLETPNPLAVSYDFIRGSVRTLSESASGVDLGAVVCLEDDSPDPSTAGHEDPDTPGAGEAFFYVSRFRSATGTGEYGGSSRNRDRKAGSGDCAR